MGHELRRPIDLAARIDVERIERTWRAGLGRIEAQSGAVQQENRTAAPRHGRIGLDRRALGLVDDPGRLGNDLNREFRRRTKTQGSFSTEDSALTLLWGLIAFGQIRMRKIDGFEQTPMLLAAVKPKAA